MPITLNPSPDWATGSTYSGGPYPGNANKATPSGGMVIEGFDPQAPLAAEYINFLFNTHGKWIDQAYNTAYFQPPAAGTDTPQEQFQDAAGNVRTVIDKNGFYTGLPNRFAEDWNLTAAMTTSFGPAFLTSNPYWFGATLGAGQASRHSPTNTYPSHWMELDGGTSNTDVALLSGPEFFPSDNISAIFDFEITTSGVSNGNIQVGLSNNAYNGLPNATQACLLFDASSASANWRAQTANNGASTFTDTGIAFNLAGAFQKLHIEHHGVNTPIGVAACYSLGANTQKALFYVDGVLGAAVNGASLSTNLMTVFLRCYTTGSGAPELLSGPVRATWSRWLAMPAL